MIKSNVLESFSNLTFVSKASIENILINLYKLNDSSELDTKSQNYYISIFTNLLESKQ